MCVHVDAHFKPMFDAIVYILDDRLEIPDEKINRRVDNGGWCCHNGVWGNLQVSSSGVSSEIKNDLHGTLDRPWVYVIFIPAQDQ